MNVVGLLKGNDELVMYSAQLLGDRLHSPTVTPQFRASSLGAAHSSSHEPVPFEAGQHN
jgi:hypothetical protein